MVGSRGRSKRLSLTPEFEKSSNLLKCSNSAFVVKYKSRFQQCPGLASAGRGPRRAVGWRRPCSELIVRPAGRAVRAESSELSRGAEGRPPMPERRLERADSHIREGAAGQSRAARRTSFAD
eukprot:scaffold18961_cov95-Phaeocystis_antarctica.AAC.3